MGSLSKRTTLFILFMVVVLCFGMLGNKAYSNNVEKNDIIHIAQTEEGNDSAADTLSAYALQDSELYYRERKYNYNCYAYAIGKYKESINVGSISGEALDTSYVSLEQITNAVVDDLEAIGCTGIVVSTVCPTSVVENQHLICVRGGWDPVNGYDYHFMKYYDGSWYHKPGLTAILKYKYQPSLDRDWTNEYIRNDDGCTGAPSFTYTGTIYYIKYYPSTYNPYSGWCEVNNYWQLTELWHNCASNFKIRIMQDIVAERLNENGFEFWERPYYFYGKIDGLNHSIKNLDLCPEIYEDISANAIPKYFYNVGFIQYNYGVIENIAICDMNENLNLGNYSSAADSITVGVIASENYGRIQNCLVGTTIIDGEVHMIAESIAVIGAVCGVNYGVVSDCFIHYCNIRTFGRLGGIAGENRGIIENCSISGSEFMLYYGAVGGIAGVNCLSVVDCIVSDTVIGCYYEYPNSSYFNVWEIDKYGRAGGIVGWNDGGSIELCTVVGNTVKYCGASINAANGGRTFAPEIGLICGISASLTGTFINNGSVVDKGNLHVETWKGGFLNLVTYTWDQAKYCGGNVGHTI